MRQIPITQLIKFSIDRAAFILFKPFSLKKWFFLILIALLAGVLGGGNGGGGSQQNPQNANQTEQTDVAAAGGKENTTIIANESVRERVRGFYDKIADEETAEDKDRKSEDQISPYAGAQSTGAGRMLLGLLLVLVILAIAAFLIWLSSRFKFIWYEAIVNNDASVKAPFRKYEKEGNSYFFLLLIIMGFALVFLVLIVFLVYQSATSAGITAASVEWTLPLVMETFRFPIVLGIIMLGAFIVCMVFLEDFLIPIMAIGSMPAMPALRNFLNIIRHNRKEFLLYVIVKLILSFVVGIIAFLVMLCIFIGALTVAAVVFGIPYLLFVSVMKINVLFLLWAVSVGIPFACLFILVMMAASLPFAVFHRIFSLSYLSSLQTDYTPISIEDLNS